MTNGRTFSKSCRNPFEIFFLVLFNYNLIFRQNFRKFSKIFDDWWFLTPTIPCPTWPQNALDFTWIQSAIHVLQYRFALGLEITNRRKVSKNFEKFVEKSNHTWKTQGKKFRKRLKRNSKFFDHWSFLTPRFAFDRIR